ncbi:nuclear transport factor 2 family protein [Mycobacterium sp. NBC_00419]|uniref:nuclear transport factor 2 family protein n=1 Tax=Mycobacterium sp. NBC_00419 TaxID=2975989 RepID=UPI002E1EA33B
MTTDNTESTMAWNALPAVVRTYLTAHRSGDVAAAIDTFTTDAAVTDEGHTEHGREAIEKWLGSAGSEYTFTTEFTGATATDAAHIDALQRLVGNFPGGVADLHYRFTLEDDLITRLVIEP